MFKKFMSKRQPPFVIIGQERSGTTLVQTLLSSHSDIHCRGELFDTWQIDDGGRKDKSNAAIFARDTDPATFLKEKLEGRDLHRPLPSVLGFKLLSHHNPNVMMKVIPDNPEWRIIHVRRANKLAQFASRQQVAKSGRWTSQGKKGPAPLIEVAPMWAVARCNALQLEDELLRHFLDTLPNPVHTVTYTTINQRETHRSILSFLGVDPDTALHSELKKQGHDRILSRFRNADEIELHFKGLKLEGWFEEV